MRPSWSRIDYAARDAITDVGRAAAPGAPQIWPEAPGNIAVSWHPWREIRGPCRS